MRILSKNIILEYKSISDDVADFAEYVGNAIINDAQNQVRTASEQTYQYFKENIFQIRVRNFLKGGNILIDLARNPLPLGGDESHILYFYNAKSLQIF